MVDIAPDTDIKCYIYRIYQPILGSPDQRVTGEGYCWKYTCNKKEIQHYRPKFTYYGFRYVQVSGAVPMEFAADGRQPGQPVIEAITGEFIYPKNKPIQFHPC